MIDLRIRAVDAGDAAAIAAIYAPYVADSAISFELDPPGSAAMLSRIETVTGRFPWLVAERGGTVVGYAYADSYRTRAAYRWTVETTVYVDRAYGRQGIGRALYAALLEEAARRGFVSALGVLTLPNAASAGLHEAMGFAHVGTQAGIGYKFGCWHDIGIWQRDLAPRRGNPAEPF